MPWAYIIMCLKPKTIPNIKMRIRTKKGASPNRDTKRR